MPWNFSAGATACLVFCANLIARDVSAADLDGKMYLAPNGIGSTLIFPYYTVNAGQSTLITVVNTTQKAKVLHLNFRQGINGGDVGEQFVFLAARDSWTVSLFATAANGVANILSDDTTCTSIKTAVNLPTLPDGRRYSPLRPHALAQQATAEEILRTREGFLEMIEVGELDTATSAWATQRRCQDLSTMYQTTFRQHLTPPGGGLYGGEAIVNAAQGTYFAQAPTAIADFSDIVVSAAELSESPATRLSMGNRHALVSVGNHYTTFDRGPVQSTWSVAALLMSDSIWSDFVREAAAGASTEWVITRPTAFDYASIEPPTPYSTCVPYVAQAQDREQNITTLAAPETPVGARPAFSLCNAVDVIQFGSQASESPQLGSRLSTSLGESLGNVPAGSVRLALGMNTAGGAQTILQGESGPILRGQPVIGFEVVNYVNANVTPGVLSNYAAASPLHTTVGCADASGAAVACP